MLFNQPILERIGLNALGLIESLDVGYRLSARGQALLRMRAPSEVGGE